MRELHFRFFVDLSIYKKTQKAILNIYTELIK